MSREGVQETFTETESIQYSSCPFHSSKPLSLYCETCQKTVCRDCVVNLCAVQKHKYGLLEEVAKKYKIELDGSTETLQELHRQISATLLAIAADDVKAEEHKAQELEKIEAVFEMITRKNEEQKTQIVSEALSRYKIQSVQNSSKTKELKGALESLTTAIQETEKIDIVRNLTTNTSVVSTQKQNLETLHCENKELSRLPSQFSDLRLEYFPQQFNPRNFLFYVGKDFKCCLSEYNLLKSLKLKQLFQIDFLLAESLNEAHIKSKLICVHDKSSVPVNVKNIAHKTYRLSGTPQSQGRHELHVLFLDSHICGSPIPALVFYEPHQLMTLGKPKLITLEAATAVKCNESNIMISSVPSTLNIMEYKRQTLTVSKEIKCHGINEFAMDGNYLYYSDIMHHRLVKADSNGRFMASIGENGSEPGQFEFPNGVRINSDHIFVSDSGNGRIQEFDTNLNFLRTIGEKGDGPGQFKQPNNLVFDEDGNMYVVECLNNRVQVLTSQGDHIRFIGTDTARFRLQNPMSLALYNGHVFVTNTGRNCISVFTQAGVFVTSFDNVHPESIDIDGNGFIYVISNRKHVLRY